MALQTADYVLVALAAAGGVMGLFRGLSGTIAFVTALGAALAVGAFGWGISAEYLPTAWMRGLATLVLALVAFGIVRAVIAKVVNSLLAQPADAIFGGLAGLIAGCLPAVIWAFSGFFTEYSSIATEISRYVW